MILQDVWIPEAGAYVPRAMLSMVESDGVLIGWTVYFQSVDTLGRYSAFRRVVLFYGVQFWGLE